VVDRHPAHPADGDQVHRIALVVRVTGREGESRRALVAHEERGDRQAELVDETGRQEVAEDPGAAFGEESRHLPFGIEIFEDGGQGQLRARVDDDGAVAQALARRRAGGGGRVDERGARAGEDAGRRVEPAAGGQRDAARVRRPAGRQPGGHPSLVADQQPRVVGADRARADQDRVGPGAQLVDLVQVLGPGQDQPVTGRVIQAAVGGDSAAQQRVRVTRHREDCTRQ
jgi:hypothetical protein